MRVSFPGSVTQQIAFSAARRSKEYTTGRGWTSGVGLGPIFGVGYAGVKTQFKFLMHQEQGTKSFLMTSLEGKVVPIKGPDGLHFIKVKGVGKPGYVTLPGGVRVWRDQKWRHPGITQTNFMRDSIQFALIENRPAILSFMANLIGQGGPQIW